MTDHSTHHSTQHTHSHCHSARHSSSSHQSSPTSFHYLIPLDHYLKMKLVKGTIDWVKHWYFIYELRTSLYMLEPWEKKLFNSILVTVLATSCYTTYVFFPRYTRNVLEYVGLI